MIYRLTDSFPYLLNRVGARIGEMFSERLAGQGLTLPMYRVLAALHQQGGQRLGDLAEMTTIETSTLSRLVKSMVTRGLITRDRPEDNARTVVIDLTPQGATLAETFIPLAEQFEAVGTRTFTAAETEWLKQALRTIYANLEDFDDSGR